MPYLDGNPTLGEQLEEDERMRFYTADILKEAREMNDEIKALSADLKAVAVVLDRVRDQLGEAIHIGLRKATDHKQAVIAWDAINDLPPEEWGAVLEFILDGLGVPEALARPGVQAVLEGVKE